jgi:hypothetical protein
LQLIVHFCNREPFCNRELFCTRSEWAVEHAATAQNARLPCHVCVRCCARPRPRGSHAPARDVLVKLALLGRASPFPPCPPPRPRTQPRAAPHIQPAEQVPEHGQVTSVRMPLFVQTAHPVACVLVFMIEFQQLRS